VKRAVFLDRDGTINRPALPGEYIKCPQEFALLGGAVEAVALLRRSGYACVVVSNQRGVALRLMSKLELAAVDTRLRELVDIDRSYYCTHGLEDRCACRKPEPGMLVRAAAELELDLARSWMVGDSESDCEAGRRVGCRTVRLQPRDGALLEAARMIATAGA
jgi:D-glycero-D-manno-heptose 1,7-bisphosphate phosphatase